MKIRPFAICGFCLLWFGVASAHAHGESAEGEPCFNASKEIEELIRKDQRAASFSIQIASLPSLQEALVSLQSSTSTSKAPEVLQVQFCAATLSMFQVRDGHVITTTVLVDRELPTWLIGLAPNGKEFPLAGFTNPSAGFNELMDAVGLHVTNADVAADVFDLYLRLTGHEALRGSVVGDEMQLQSKGLEDFRLRYSLPRARSKYERWWTGISPAVKNSLRRPHVAVEQNGFRVSYFRYSEGRILQEVVAFGNDGTIKAAESKPIYSQGG
jgi:hypothetical protein